MKIIFKDVDALHLAPVLYEVNSTTMPHVGDLITIYNKSLRIDGKVVNRLISYINDDITVYIRLKLWKE